MNPQTSVSAININEQQQQQQNSEILTMDAYEMTTDENASNNFINSSQVNHLVEHDYCKYDNLRIHNNLEYYAIDSSKKTTSHETINDIAVANNNSTILPVSDIYDTNRSTSASLTATLPPSSIFTNVANQANSSTNLIDSSCNLKNHDNLREKKQTISSNTHAPTHSMNDSLSDSSSQASTSALVIDSPRKKILSKFGQMQDSPHLAPSSPTSPSVSSTRRSQRQMERGGRRSFKNLGDDESSQDSPVQNVPKSRARQLVSVTDKSEWITGEDQIDSIISQELGQSDLDGKVGSQSHRNKLGSLTSSPANYLSDSDLASDDDSEYDPDSDNDPDKLWCSCRQPHNNKFMICCDVCKDWFHGHCVNVTKLMGARIEKEGREWFCPECQSKIKSGTPRSSIQKKPASLEKNRKNRSKPNKISSPSSVPTSTVKRGRGRPRKSDQALSQPGKLSISLKDGVGQIKQQMVESIPVHRPIKKQKSSLDPKLGVDNGKLKKKLARMDARSQSFDEHEESIRLKRLIKERKKEFLAKHKLMDQEKQAKRCQLGVGKQTITASLGESLDSLVSTTSVPNIDSSTKNGPALNNKPNIVLQISTTGSRNQDSGVSEGYDVTSRIVTVVRSPNKKIKLRETIDPSVDDLFKAEPLQITKKSLSKIPTLSIDGASNQNLARKFSLSSSGDSPTDPSPARRRSDSGSFNHNKHHNKSPPETNSPNGQPSTPTKKTSKDKEGLSSSPVNGVSCVQNTKDMSKGGADSGKTESTRQIVRKTIGDTLTSRCKDINDITVASDTIKSIAGQIEDQLNECFREGTSKYLNRYRSLIFNLRDAKNQGLLRKVLTSEISPQKLVRMSPEELASSELAKWRERENKHSLELIKRDARLAAQQVILKKTHKGEEVISGPTQAEEPSYLDEPNLGKDEKSSNQITSVGTSQISEEENKIVESTDAIDTTSIKKSPGNDTVTPESDKTATTKTIRVSIDGNKILQEAAKYSSMMPPISSSENSPMDTSEPPNTTESLDMMDVDDEQNNQDVGFDNNDDDNDDLDSPVQNSAATGFNKGLNDTDEQSPAWRGSITMPDVAQFDACAHPVSGDVSYMEFELGDSLQVCGRIAPNQVEDYIGKLRNSTRAEIMIVQLTPEMEEVRDGYYAFFDYLDSRNRYGVIGVNPKILKDFYILPVGKDCDVPDWLLPFNGPGIMRKQRDDKILLAILVRPKRSTLTRPSSHSVSANTSASGETVYNPTPIQ